MVDFLTDDVSASETVLAGVMTDVRRCAPGANAGTKVLLEKIKQLDGPQTVALAADAFADSVRGGEGKEGRLLP